MRNPEGRGEEARFAPILLAIFGGKRRVHEFVRNQRGVDQRGVNPEQGGNVVGPIAGAGCERSGPFRQRAADTGMAVVQAAGSRRSVSDATIEIVTTENAIVATLTPDSRGRASKDLPEGVYTVRVSHPRYEADVHRIHVLPRETVEIRASLRAGSSSPIQRVLNSGASAFRRALRF